MKSTAEKKTFQRCSTCNDLKPLSDFHKDRRNANGYRGVCKSCRVKPKRKIWCGVSDNQGLCHECGMLVDMDNWAADSGHWDMPFDEAAQLFEEAKANDTAQCKQPTTGK